MSKHKVLIVGSGGREHALGWKLAKSEEVEKLYFAPGNGGTQQLGTNLDFKVDEARKIVNWSKKQKVDLIVVGPETALENGLGDEANKAGIPVFGPTKAAARLESSKSWALEFMERHGVPHPGFKIFNHPDEAIEFVEGGYWPRMVVKADGLAAGKGVLLPESKDEAIAAINMLMVDKAFGKAGEEVVVQERITGPEFSVFAMTDGKNYVMLPAVQDHKRVFDDNDGPNTGGMGAYSPVPFVDQRLMQMVENQVIAPTIKGMANEGHAYKGVLYAGMMLTKDGPKVIEFNARFGDPECQPLMMMIDEDLYPVLKACAEGNLSKRKLTFREGAAACVVLAAKGYPEKYEMGKTINGLDKIYDSDIGIFHAGTKLKGKEVVSDGGRVVGVSGYGESFEEARRKVYQQIGTAGVNFDGMHYRTDIGNQSQETRSKKQESGNLIGKSLKLIGAPVFKTLYWGLGQMTDMNEDISSVTRIEVTTRNSHYPDVEGAGVLAEINDLGIDSVDEVRVMKVYKLEGLDDAEVERVTELLLVEKLWQEYEVTRSLDHDIKGSQRVVEIARKPGVMDTEIESIMKAVRDMGIMNLQMAGTGKKYIFEGDLSDEELELITNKILMNKIVDRVITEPEVSLMIKGTRAETETISIREMDDVQLMQLSKDKLWLNLDEMHKIQDYYLQEDKDPTDVEIETLAQTWSEHCCHKTFTADLVINGKKKPTLMSRIKAATKKVNRDWCLSVFTDNAGVIDFNEQYAICGKAETHNSPSAIEPYGGAMTGSGGVFRDIVACGLGAKVLVSTDMFCFAPPNLDSKLVPPGCLHPRRLLKEVVRGVKDYGNRMGIPTNNGSVHFHEDWRAKPTVIVGSYGIMPKKYVKKKKLRPDDVIISVGGKTGRDGIHGATFSSGSMTDRTGTVSSSAVQIGNPIEEKRMFDAILVCRDRDLLRFVQDCGGGGYSSAIGEVAEELGAVVYLDQVPLKYPGLASWEIWISESQERMILIVDPDKVMEVEQIMADYNVEATVLGKLTGDKRLRLYYEDQLEADLDVDFLHHGRPQIEKYGTYKENKATEPSLKKPKNYLRLMKSVLESWDICSKEAIVRQYDHEVQGTSVLKPFVGKFKDAPNDAVVIAPWEGITKDGSDPKRRNTPWRVRTGMAVAHGMIPVYNKIDPYWGSAAAIDEAVRNLVAVGVDPDKIALLDNFIWPTPDEESLGDLDRSVDACYETAVSFKMPFVSGKDSLSSTYKASDGTVIKIPPTLCISAFAPVKDIYKTITADLKQPGNYLFVVGVTKKELGGSAYYGLHKELGNSVPKHDSIEALRLYKTLHKAIKQRLVVAAHDCSEGGLGVAVAEMCFGEWGAEIALDKMPISGKDIERADFRLFSESNSRLVVEVMKSKVSQFKQLMQKISYGQLGKVARKPNLVVRYQNKLLFDVKTQELKKSWKRPMEKVFG